jgi:hypothetical protein
LPVFVTTKVYGTPALNVVRDDWIVLSASVISTWVPLPDELDALVEELVDGVVDGSDCGFAALAGLPQAAAIRLETIITNSKIFFFIFTPFRF